jgi:hypothetical protein
MDLSISTPAPLFSAISLLILACTNKFLALVSLIRQLVEQYEKHNDDNVLKQIDNYQIRLKLIKYTQVFGVVSFFCVISMFLVFIKWIIPAEIVFGICLISMFVSLLLSLQEIFISIGALNIDLNRIKKESQQLLRADIAFVIKLAVAALGNFRQALRVGKAGQANVRCTPSAGDDSKFNIGFLDEIFIGIIYIKQLIIFLNNKNVFFLKFLFSTTTIQ